MTLLIGCQRSIFEKSIPDVLGVENVKIKLLESFDDFGGFGEGYTFEAFEITEQGVNAFLNKAVKVLPENKSETSWNKVNWTKPQIDSLNKEVWTMCLNYASADVKLQKYLSDVKNTLQKEDSYYAFYYKPDLENPQDVQLFIIDISGKKLYVIESNI